MHNHSLKNKFNLQVNLISFWYERIDTKTHFVKEAKHNNGSGLLEAFQLLLCKLLCIINKDKKCWVSFFAYGFQVASFWKDHLKMFWGHLIC